MIKDHRATTGVEQSYLPAAQRIKVASGQHQHNLADRLVDCFELLDIDYVFGIPGGAIEPLYNALARHQRVHRNAPKIIVSRHEAGAAFMADGYTRETGKLGVCCATTGPGTTNLITGVASAYADRIPTLVITPQTALPSFGRQGLQESTSDAIDTVGMFQNCTRYNSLISHVEQFDNKFRNAIHTAYGHPHGPVHLSIPKDLMVLTYFPRQHHSIERYLRSSQAVDNGVLERFCRELSVVIHCDKQVVLFLGRECASAINEIMAFALLLDIPVITSPRGKGLFEPSHYLYRGVYGYDGHRSAADLLKNPRVGMIMAVGTSLAELSTSSWDNDLMNEKMVHITADIESFSRSPMAFLHVHGNLQVIFSTLKLRLMRQLDAGYIKSPPHQELDRVLANKQPQGMPNNIVLDEVEQCLNSGADGRLHPQWLMTQLVEILPRQSRFVIDAGNSWAWAIHYLQPKIAGTFHIGMGYGAMAWAVGAAIGVALGCRSKGLNNVPVVALTGDGSFLMSGQEITVAVQHKLPVLYVILNDQELGMVKHGQRLGGAEQVGYQLPPVDFAKMASAMGAKGYTIRNAQDLEQLDLDQLPALLDVYIDPEQVPPMGIRMKGLKGGSGAFGIDHAGAVHE